MAKDDKKDAKDATPEENPGTEYVVFTQAIGPEDKALAKALTDGRVWIQAAGQGRGKRGDEVIKETNRRPDGLVTAGTYKAVPASNWNADANNLISALETSPRNVFNKPSTEAPATT